MLVTVIKIKVHLTNQNINLLHSCMKNAKVDGSGFIPSYQFYCVIHDNLTKLNVLQFTKQ